MQDPTSSAPALVPSRPTVQGVTSPKPPWSPVASLIRTRRRLPTPKPRRVLLVEADDEQRFALKAQLSRSGFQVTVALDDVSAAWSLEYCHHDAVILDLGAPGSRMIEFLTEVGQSKALPSVVILTGGDEQQQNLALTLGADLVLQKPCTVDELSLALDRLLVG